MNSLSEVSLKSFIKKMFDRKIWYILSIMICGALAYGYIKTATPMYKVTTTLLIDASGDSRKMGESQYMGGGVGLIETEKNLFNEVGIIKSFNLVKKTVDELGFNLSYHSENWYKEQEHYGYFPVEVTLIDTSAQAYGVKYYIEMLSDDQYKLRAVGEEFTVSNPSTNTKRKVTKPLEFTETYNFGQEVKHDYFHFIVNKPKYKVVLDNFEGMDLFFKIRSLEGLTNAYMKRLKVNQTDIQASILKLQTDGAVPDKEIDFLKRHSENYIKSKLEERDEIAFSKENFIRKQLASVSDSLARAERRVEAFRRSSHSVNLSQTASNSLDQVQTLQSDRAQIELNIKYYNSLLQYLSDSTGLDKMVAPSMVGIEDPLLNENLLELKRLYTEKTRLEFTKGSKSFDLEIHNQQIRNTTNSLRENLKNLIRSSQLSLSDVNGRIVSLEGVINRLPTNEKQLLNYERKSDLYENLYKYLSQELAKTGIAKAEDIADTRVLNEARMVGTGPVAPQKKLIFLLALMIGMLIPTVGIILFDSFDGVIMDLNHLDSITSVPIVASIARDSKGAKLFGSNLAEWRVEESFRDLSANLQFLIPDREKNVIGVTSTVPNEGKTFVAVNLAINLAKMGKKVLLIDTDLRNPSLPIQDDEKGLSDYIKNDNIFYNQIMRTHEGLDNLHYIPTHVVLDNPHEFLLSSKLETLFLELKEPYDYVVVDAPAIGVVSDYLLTMKYVDITLFVTRRKVSKLSFVRDMEKWKRKGKVEGLYLVLNDVVGRSFKYGQSYRYGDSKNKNSVEKYFTSAKTR